MSAAVNVVSLTIAIAGESELAAGDGVGAAEAAASVGFEGVVCLAGGAVLVLRTTGLGLAFCAVTIGASVNASNKIKGDMRFMKCIFLVASELVNWSLAGEFFHRCKRVYFAGRLVAAESYDARKAQSVAALMPIRRLYAVESHFNDDRWLDDAHSAVRVFLHSVSSEPLSHLGNFDIRQPGIRLADS